MGCVTSVNARTDLEGQPVGLKHFDKGRVLGEGGFGKVKAVTKRGETPAQWFAMKVLNKENVMQKKRFEEIFRERDMLTNLRHDRICNLYYAFQDPKHLYLVMDLALGGDLRYQLNHNAHGLPFTEDRVRIYSAQIIEALDYCHSKGVIHRDVKPENILLDGQGWVMLTDFGIARQVDSNGLCRSGSGTGGYMPPELYTKSHAHSKTTDWFALGVAIHEFLTKRRPFRAEDLREAGRLLPSNGKRKASIDKEIVQEPLIAQFQHDYQNEDLGLSKECIDLLTRLFTVKRDSRLGVNGVSDFKSHAWFTSSQHFDWAKVNDGTHSVPFLPNTKRMNAEPDADIHAVFMGEEEERRLRNLTPTEQKLFEGYEYDYNDPQSRAPLVRNFGSVDTKNESRKTQPASSGCSGSSSHSIDPASGSGQTRTHRVRTSHRYSTHSMDESARTTTYSQRQDGATTNSSTTSETTRGADVDDDENLSQHSKVVQPAKTHHVASAGPRVADATVSKIPVGEDSPTSTVASNSSSVSSNVAYPTNTIVVKEPKVIKITNTSPTSHPRTPPSPPSSGVVAPASGTPVSFSATAPKAKQLSHVQAPVSSATLQEVSDVCLNGRSQNPTVYSSASSASVVDPASAVASTASSHHGSVQSNNGSSGHNIKTNTYSSNNYYSTNMSSNVFESGNRSYNTAIGNPSLSNVNKSVPVVVVSLDANPGNSTANSMQSTNTTPAGSEERPNNRSYVA